MGEGYRDGQTAKRTWYRGASRCWKVQKCSVTDDEASKQETQQNPNTHYMMKQGCRGKNRSGAIAERGERDQQGSGKGYAEF